MATCSNDRTLRAILLGSSILGIPVLIGGTVVSEKAQQHYWYYSSGPEAVPIVFSFIPIFFTIVFSAVCLVRSRKQKDETCASGQAVRLLMDFSLVLSYLGVLIPFYVIEPRRLHDRANWMLLEAYASFFLVANMFIHFFLVCRYIKTSVSSFRALYSSLTLKECPHCHKQLTGTGPQMARGRLGREGYSLLHAEDYLDEDAMAYDASAPAAERQSTETAKSSMDV